jgi:hypothetical protein
MSKDDPWGRGKNGSWIQTKTGKRFFVLSPEPEDFDIEDIAHALSNQCRFTGHVNYFYSVAEHSLRVCSLLMQWHPEDTQLAFDGLMHDASEAYLPDLARPIKQLPEFTFYRDIEDSLAKHIAVRFGSTHPIPAEVHRADSVLLGTEARDLMYPVVDNWHLRYELLDEPVDPWTPGEAKGRFLARYRHLMKAMGRTL